MDQPLYLANLHKGREKKAITVRVVRKWTVKEYGGEGAPLYIGMVFADAKGDAIYAEIPKETIHLKEGHIDVGKIYTIKKFRVLNAKATYRAVDKPLMIELSEYTTVEISRNPPAAIPDYIYSLTPFSEIVPADRTVFKYTDVIGYITKYTALETFIPKNKEKVTSLRELYIKDLRDNMLKVTLWGDHATNFNIDAVYDEEAGNIVVCLLVGCIPRRLYNDYDKIYLSGSAALAYYFNPHIAEAAPFYSRFNNIPMYIDRPPQTEATVPMQLQDKPLQHKTLAELNAILDPFDFEDGAYKCTVTITAISENTKWWYMSCRPCKKKPIQQPDQTYRCPKCAGSDVVPRYLLSFSAKDDTAKANFFAYDDEATIIIGKDCESVMNPISFASGLPQYLQNIINKTYVFAINLSDDSSRRYIVKSVLQKPPRRTAQTNVVASAANVGTSTAQLINLDQPESSALVLQTTQTETSVLDTLPIADKSMTPLKNSLVPSLEPAAAVQTPQPETNILHIQSIAELTPVPPVDDVELFPTHDKYRSPPEAPTARRTLLFTDSTRSTEEAAAKNMPATDAISDEDSAATESTLQPKLKRTKPSSSRQSSKGGARKSSSSRAVN